MTMSTWEISGTDTFDEWFQTLEGDERNQVITAVEMLANGGPTLGRPTVDHIIGSRHHNMKELRPRGAAKNIRILFAFDPAREALLLIGGSKEGNWSGWYAEAIPAADDMFDDHLAEFDS